MMKRVRSPFGLTALLFGALSLVTVVAACGSNSGTSGGPGSDDGGSDDATADGSGLADGATDANFMCDGCPPFPGMGAPQCDPMVLGPPTLVYPPDGVLLPPNMNVLEVQWVPPAGASLFEVDFENSVTDVRVETACNSITSVRGAANVGCGLTLSQQQWNDIANTNRDGDPVKVTVRAVPPMQQCVSTSPQKVKISFAKEDLTGGIYYWQSATYGGTAGKTGGIYYHDFGTFDPTPTPFYTSGAQGTCVGCHTLSKDGARMSLMTDDPDADDEYGDVKTHVMDVASRTVIGGGTVGPGFQTFTHDHKMMVASIFKTGPMGGTTPDAAFSVWNGDGTTQIGTDALPSGMQGTQPNLSFDDQTLVFVSPAAGTISTAGDHHFMGGSLWKASFNATSGALSSFAAVLTASGTQSFYYPDQSPDGDWLVFNENDDTSAGNNDGDCFYSRKSRVKLLHFPPQQGDMPIDLANLNVADGLSNSWPRWSPAVQTYKNHHILWVTFSSNRDYGVHLKNTANGYPQGMPGFDNYYPPESPAYDQPQPSTKQGVTFDNYASPQIWMAAIVVDPDRSLDSSDRSFPAFWLPFQDVTAHNHSAQWVSKVQSGPPPGGDAGGSCNEAGGTCGTGGGTCCSDVVCCQGTCQYACVQ